MTEQISFLKPNDEIRIVAPAKAIEAEHVLFSKNILENAGFKVSISKFCLGHHNYFSGSEFERLEDFQEALDDPNVKAILCARGGYGCVQILDKLQWASFLREPKWIIGFSDVTIFHQRVLTYGLKSIHGTMPLNFSKNSHDSIETLIKALTGIDYNIACSATNYNKTGSAKGKLVGGNLSILYSLLGTNDMIDYSDTILVIEDLAEQLYHLDRMFYAFSKAGILDKIKGLIVGGMTDMKDTIIPFGKSYQEIILSHFEYRKIPICFDFPVGHIDDNRAIILGEQVELSVSLNGVEMNYLKL